MSDASRRLTLAELRAVLLEECLGAGWVTPSECVDELDLDHGLDWHRTALLLERLANDGVLEFKASGRVRTFRRRPSRVATTTRDEEIPS